MQTPFLTAMEKYLAVRPIRPPKTPSSTRSWRWESQERAFRRSHPSTSLEASEESAHEAFAQGKTVGQDNIASKLVERVVLPKKNSKPAVFSFVNTSDSGAIGMSSVGRGKMQNEHGQREKKARRSERVQKAKAEMAQRQAAKRV